ncbi:UNVERIFIED_CONTAM: hypothetical protein Sradi_4034200 [Sesamum radiatum]|uniref:Uncharacterized protein n=1 Tax=Sesamum radiatum TaxID=300843 RepID=A0AAW2PJH3_SESRA
MCKLSSYDTFPRVVGPTADPPRRSISLDTSMDELSPTMLRAIQRIVSAAIWEQITTLVPPRIATPSDVDIPEEEAEEHAPMLAPLIAERQGAPPLAPQDVITQWFARFEHLQKELQDVRYRIEGAPEDEQQRVIFTEAVMADELSANCRTPAIAEYNGTTDPMEHLSRFENAALLHRYTDGIKCRVFVTTFVWTAQQWFNQLPVRAIGSF